MFKRKKEYLEDIVGKEFYNFYKKNRRKFLKVIDEYNYFVKVMYGMILEFK